MLHQIVLTEKQFSIQNIMICQVVALTQGQSRRHNHTIRVRRFRLINFFRCEAKLGQFRFIFACSNENKKPLFFACFASFRFPKIFAHYLKILLEIFC
jgi:hypothetical protein